MNIGLDEFATLGAVPDDAQPGIAELLALAPVMPVVVIHDLAHAVPLAKALVAGGLPAVEVTLRTLVALDAIKAIAEEVEGAKVGAGTVLSQEQLEAVLDLGAAFAVSPGATDRLIDAAVGMSIPLLPGVATPGEVMRLGEQGYHHLKFFPASPAGGPKYLEALSSPLQRTRFCPTGGVSMANALEYLRLPNVACVGGSWVAPKKAVEEGAWGEVERLAREAAGLRDALTSG